MEFRQTDLLGAGKEQLVMEAAGLRVAVAPERGGRIIDLTHDGVPALHRLYPEGFAFGPYTEYGGIEEHVGSAPGAVWNVPWEWERENGSVTLSAYSGKTLVRKRLTLDDDMPLLRVDYELSNYSNNLARFTFGIHPEIAPGGDHRAAKFHVPLEGRVESGGYTSAGFRRYVQPDHGWCAATGGERLFLQMLPHGVADCVEIYYPRVDTHLVLQPVVFGVGLSPEMSARFRYMIYFGPGDESAAQGLYEQMMPELNKEYVAAAPPPANLQPPKKDQPNGGDFGFDRAIEQLMREGGRAPDDDRARRDAERDRRNAERERERERDRAQREHDRAHRHSGEGARRGRNVDWAEPVPPVPPVPGVAPVAPAWPAPPAAADRGPERLAILQMVAEGKIGIDDAVRLLDSVER